MKRWLLVLLAVLAGALVARPASAHMVNVGVGTQTWFELRPRKLVVRFNLGFATLKGQDEMKLADANKDHRVAPDEEQPYLEGLIKRILPHLKFHLDGKPLELRFVRGQAYGLQGEVSPTPFDTFFDLEADVAVGPGLHELVYYEGTYEGDVSQQILHVVMDHSADFATFELEQKTHGPPAIEEAGAITLQGRDVTTRIEFSPAALQRDKAEALLEPCMAGMQDTVDQLATNVARSTESDLRVLPIGPVRLGLMKSAMTTGGSGFNISAPVAKDRTGASSSTPELTGAASRFRSKDVEEKEQMEAKLKEPFTILAILAFFTWGMIHATTPGHGKTMVAAYLLGTKGRVWDAVRLGLIVTFTHTFTLYTFGLGLVVVTSWMRVSKDVLYGRTTFLITLFSGLGLWLFGLGLAWRRSRAKAEVAHAHSHEHSHDHAHDHGHAAPLPEKLEAPKTGKKLGLVMAAPIEVAAAEPHTHSHGEHTHSHGEHGHSHDGHAHSHGGHAHSHEGMSEDEHAAAHAREVATEITSFSDLLKLGIVGGIIPCPAGVLLILGSIGTAIPPLKTFLYLVSFSIGLGSVIVAIATAMVFSKKFLDRALGGSGTKGRRALAVLPVVSAVIVSCIGLGIAYSAFDPKFERAKAKLNGLLSSAAPTK